MTIYGVDTNKPITSPIVRDAIIECFYQAHKEVLDQIKNYDENIPNNEAEKMNKEQIKILVETFFEEIGGNYQIPKKQDLIKVCDKLADFAKSFREPEIIKKHYNEILSLINMIKE